MIFLQICEQQLFFTKEAPFLSYESDEKKPYLTIYTIISIRALRPAYLTN